MIAPDGQEWMFLVIKQAPTYLSYGVSGSDKIVESFSDPIEAAQHALNANKKQTGYHFLEAQPVIASVVCETLDFYHHGVPQIDDEAQHDDDDEPCEGDKPYENDVHDDHK